MRMFLPITKVDAVRREVHGIMAEEAVDKSGETFDYDSSKPLVMAWANDFAKQTNGASFGNVRAMHEPIAAGKLVSIDFDDSNKCIPVVARVVDDEAWKKCVEGVYTGFSIGGSYVKRWNDGKTTRYTARPTEVSLVDNPCMYGAKFLMVKAGGAQEQQLFKGHQTTPVELLKAARNRPFGMAEFFGFAKSDVSLRARNFLDGKLLTVGFWPSSLPWRQSAPPGHVGGDCWAPARGGPFRQSEKFTVIPLFSVGKGDTMKKGEGQPTSRAVQAPGKGGNQNIAELGKATRFQPGQSGNPHGRRRDAISATLRALMDEVCPFDKEGRTWSEAIAWAMVKRALRGDVRAFSEIADRVDGKPRQAIELSGPDGNSLPLGMTIEECDRRIAQLLENGRKRAAEAIVNGTARIEPGDPKPN